MEKGVVEGCWNIFVLVGEGLLLDCLGIIGLFIFVWN